MTAPLNNFYSHAILNYAPQTTEISAPTISGTQANIFIAKSKKEKQIFRYKSDETSLRNLNISKILFGHGIHVPHTKIFFYKQRALEVYPYIPGRTLFEYIQDGMTTLEIERVYLEIALEMKQMGQIPISKFDNIKNKNCAQVAKYNILTKTQNPILAHSVFYGTQILNNGPKTICHCDLNPRNIVLDTKHHLAGILDLDAISVANINFSVALCGYNLKHVGQNPELFYKMAGSIMPNQLNKNRIKIMEKIFEFYFSKYCCK